MLSINFYKNLIYLILALIFILICSTFLIKNFLLNESYFARFTINDNITKHSSYRGMYVKNLLVFNKKSIHLGEGYYILKLNENESKSLEVLLNKFYNLNQKINFVTYNDCISDHIFFRNDKKYFNETFETIYGFSENLDSIYYQDLLTTQREKYYFIHSCYYDTSFNLIYVGKISLKEIEHFIKKIFFSNFDPKRQFNEFKFLFF